jgi:hypothetical protein
MNALDHALSLVDLGLAVHLLKPGSKAPLQSEWSAAPVHTRETLAADFRKGQNIGVRTGAPSKAGGAYWHVIDVDVRDTALAHEAHAALARFLPSATHFPTVASGSGGASRHVYFTTDSPQRSRKLAHSKAKITDAKGDQHWAWEIELFGTGKQVAAPPSIHPDSGRPYKWIQSINEFSAKIGLYDVPSANLERWFDRREKQAESADSKDRRGASIEDARDICNRLIAKDADVWCEDYDGWLKVGMALHHEFEGSEDGFEVWCEFSEHSAKYNPDVQRAKWESFRRSESPSAATFATLQHAVRNEMLAEKFEDLDDSEEPDIPALNPTPYRCEDESQIPVRPWLYGRSYLRGGLSVLIAPGGVGKSSLTVVEALAMATGRTLLGESEKPVAPLRVWYVNLEDPSDELRRRFAAARKHYGIDADAIGGRLFTDGANLELVIAEESGKRGFRLNQSTVAALKAAITSNDIDVMMIDPFVSSHRVGENDNTRIDAIAKTWAKIAQETNCAVLLVHHTRKAAPGQTDRTAEDSRGAGALTAAARNVRVLNRMSDTDAKKLGVTDHPWTYLRIDDGKANYGPPNAKAEWRKIENVELVSGERVGVITQWERPAGGAVVDSFNRDNLLRTLKGGNWRKASNSPSWIGKPIAKALDLDLAESADRAKVSAIIADWERSGLLTSETRKDEKRREREYLIPVIPDDLRTDFPEADESDE